MQNLPVADRAYSIALELDTDGVYRPLSQLLLAADLPDLRSVVQVTLEVAEADADTISMLLGPSAESPYAGLILPAGSKEIPLTNLDYIHLAGLAVSPVTTANITVLVYKTANS